MRRLASSTFLLLSLISSHLVLAGEVRIETLPGQAPLGAIELHGVAAGEFDRQAWEAGRLHFLPDLRTPLIEPLLGGTFRNIYAASAVETEDGWRLFFGGWDGRAIGRDCIYSLLTPDFLDFHDRRVEIESGNFWHICNVSGVRLPDHSWRVACTLFPIGENLNRPVLIASKDGQRWNGSPAPYQAQASDLIELTGYDNFAQSDINGMNALLVEDGLYRLYFGDFKAHTRVRRATSKDGHHFQFDGNCLQSAHMVNDVKRLTWQGKPCYLMGLHANGDKLWYALSDDGLTFQAEQVLAEAQTPAERYIVSHGWVLRGNRVLGFVYGASPVRSLDRNRIFARWLQKKCVFTTTDGQQIKATGALGPDRQLFSLGDSSEITASAAVYGEDGNTLCGKSEPLLLRSGGVYRLKIAD